MPSISRTKLSNIATFVHAAVALRSFNLRGSFARFSDEYRQIDPSIAATATVMCEVKPLDQISTERNIKNVDLVKIDVEGFEFEVLEGFQKHMASIRAIIVEVSLVRSVKAGSDLLALMTNRLTTSGFETAAVVLSLYAGDKQPVTFNILARRAS